MPPKKVKTEVPAVEARALPQQPVRTPVVPRNRAEPLTALFLTISVLASAVSAFLSWYVLQPSAHLADVEADRQQQAISMGGTTHTVPELRRSREVNAVGPEITADPNSLGKDNPFEE